jgi:hypothetical protein
MQDRKVTADGLCKTNVQNKMRRLRGIRQRR